MFNNSAEELAKTRTIEIKGDTNDDQASRIIAMLLFLQAEDKRKPIILNINSPGGSVTASLAILDTMSILRCPIKTHCSEQTAGTALSILARGTKGMFILN